MLLVNFLWSVKFFFLGPPALLVFSPETLRAKVKLLVVMFESDALFIALYTKQFSPGIRIAILRHCSVVSVIICI